MIPAKVFMAARLRRKHFIFFINEQLQHPVLQCLFVSNIFVSTLRKADKI